MSNVVLIKKWDIVFAYGFINNNKFEQFLLDDVLAEQLGLVQVSQLLLIRHGYYKCLNSS